MMVTKLLFGTITVQRISWFAPQSTLAKPLTRQLDNTQAGFNHHRHPAARRLLNHTCYLKHKFAMRQAYASKKYWQTFTSNSYRSDYKFRNIFIQI